MVSSMQIKEIIRARGHPNILSTHRTTFEITKDVELTKRGDCIIAVGASKGASDLSPEFKSAMKRDDARITITIEAAEVREVVNARGSHLLLLDHPTDLVIRKSNFICGRTLAGEADKAAIDLSRKLAEKSQNPNQEILITLVAEVSN